FSREWSSDVCSSDLCRMRPDFCSRSETSGACRVSVMVAGEIGIEQEQKSGRILHRSAAWYQPITSVTSFKDFSQPRPSGNVAGLEDAARESKHPGSLKNPGRCLTRSEEHTSELQS